MTEEPKMDTAEEIDELPSVAAELIGNVLEGSVELLAFFDHEDDNESCYSVEDIDGSLNVDDDGDDDDIVEEALAPPKVTVVSGVVATPQEETFQAPAVFLQSRFCEKATFEEGDASWGGWAPSHDLFGDRPFERYFQSFGHAAALQADMNVPSLASMEMDQPCMGPCEEEFANEGWLSEDFVDFVGALETDISANLAACKIQWTFRMMQEWREIQLQQWEMRAMAANRGVRCQDQAATKIQRAWREMQIWRQVQLRLWEQQAMALNGEVRCPNQAAGQIQRAFRRFQVRRDKFQALMNDPGCHKAALQIQEAFRKMKAVQKTKHRFEAERNFALTGGKSLAEVLCPEVEFGKSALDSSGTAVGARPDELDAEELANVWTSFCDLFFLATADAATAIQKAWRSHREHKRPKLPQVKAAPRICCPITRMLEAMKALQDAAREDAAKCIQKQYRASKQVKIDKAAKESRAQFAEQAVTSVAVTTTLTPLPPSTPKQMNSRRPSTRRSLTTGEAPTTPSRKCQQRPSGCNAAQWFTQVSSASTSAPVSPVAPSTADAGPSPRRRPPRVGIPESFKLDDSMQSSPVSAKGGGIANDFAALGSEIFNISTPRSKGSRSTTSPRASKSPRSLGTMFSAESPRWSHASSSPYTAPCPFSKRVPLTRPSKEPVSPRTPRGTTRVGALLPEIAQAQRSGGENTARMLEAITRKNMM